jgi:hypothetical protein
MSWPSVGSPLSFQNWIFFPEGTWLICSCARAARRTAAASAADCDGRAWNWASVGL